MPKSSNSQDTTQKTDHDWLDCALDGSLEYRPMEGVADWLLWRDCMVYGLACVADHDGQFAFDPAFDLVSLLVMLSGHKRAMNVWRETDHRFNWHGDEEAEACKVWIDVSRIARDLFYLKQLEIIFVEDGFCFLRLPDLDEALTYPASFEQGYSNGEVTHADRLAQIEQLRQMPYQEYLQSDVWQERRLRHIEAADNRCQLCNRLTNRLHVHHRTYERRGFERATDLIVLCADCHRLFHEHGRLQK